jgi:VIT1/CCC1 family predicted Fe2+/Mn2+ transporter
MTHLSYIEEKHYVNRSGWLRAAVLGANDGIISTSSLVIGVAAASTERTPILLAAVAGLVAGALSMAAGEYVSVSSQSDIENADIERERHELEHMPEGELIELAKIYENRGLTPNLALEVAQQLTHHNALEAHMRDELGMNEITQANPLLAALASGASFIIGGILPVLVSLLSPLQYMVVYQYVCAIIFLVLLGILSAKIGGSSILKAVSRVCFWGTIAMGITAGVGYLFSM